MALVFATLLFAASAQAVQIYRFIPLPSTSQAGGHPDVAISFAVGNRVQNPSPCACNDPKNVSVHLPTGLIGNPHATPQCTIAAFASEECPTDSQIGVAEIHVSTCNIGEPPFEECTTAFLAPLYVLVAPPEDAGLLGFKTGIFASPVLTVLSSRTDSDYGVDATSENTPHFFPLFSFKEDIWGIPSESVHDDLRFGFREVPIFGGSGEDMCTFSGEKSSFEPTTMRTYCVQPGQHRAVGEEVFFGGPGHSVPSDTAPLPFWQNPTTCGGSPLAASLNVLSYVGEFTQAPASYPATTDCDQLTFNPSQSVVPTTGAADSPSGAELHLTIPQFESPSVPSPSELRALTLTLPEGFSLAPNVANGKTTCSDAEARFGTTAEAQCPEDAKIGTLSINTPVLPGPLPGAAYLGEPLPGNRFRLFLALDGFGLHIKLAGTVTPDPATGRIKIAFQNLPQTPFETFDVHIFGSERGALDTPTQCGSYEVASVFTPWDAALPEQSSHQFFQITEGPNGTPCPNGPRPFNPGLKAASAANTAGAHTAFSIYLTRDDGEQNLKALDVTTPPGFAATLRGLTYCPEAAIAAAGLESRTGLTEQRSPSCPGSSLIGETSAGVGSGNHPLFLPGKAYLAGPYRGAPLSLVIITPAVSGGYDLGNVVVRAALHINPETAQITAVSDPLPQIFQGIPLRLRAILLDVNRPGFALNPTNCDPLAISALVLGTEGAAAQPAENFQVANCSSLGFAPSLAMRFSGSTKRTGDPALTTTLAYPTRGGPFANVASATVTLPPTEVIDNAHLKNPCTKVQFAQGTNPGEKCPAGSVIGFARAETPLLEKPLEGPVYLRSAPENKSGLPDLVAALNGQIDITLDGKISTAQGNRIRTTFATVPDAPVSHFTLSLDGGSKGLLENSTNLCARPLHASAAIAGQNGMSANQNPLLRAPCGKKHKRVRHERSKKHRAKRHRKGSVRS